MNTTTLYFVGIPEADGSMPAPSLFDLNENFDFVSQDLQDDEKVFGVDVIIMDDTTREINL